MAMEHNPVRVTAHEATALRRMTLGHVREWARARGWTLWQVIREMEQRSQR